MSRSAGLSGTLGDLPLPDLLALLEATGQSGVLELRGSAPAMLVVGDGRLLLGLADDGPTLQQVVLGSGVATADAWERAHLASLTGTSLGDALVAEGADDAALGAVLREQVVSTVFELLLAPDDTFAFLPGASHPIGGRHPLAAADVLAEAEQRVEAWKVIAESIPSTAAVLRLARTAPAAQVVVDADDWRVLARIDGHATVAELIEQIGQSAFAVCAVLHRLIEAGVVEHLDAEG